ncbi:MAG: GntR family transcriptional regulator [Desulfobacterales bacterium]|nr:GntR family transcriptional regulator [Desulfobacterales bacterium]
MIENNTQTLKSKKDIAAIRSKIKKNSRDLLLFDLITQTGIPVKHLLQLKIGNIIDISPEKFVEIPVSETENYHKIKITNDIFQSFQNIKKIETDKNEYVFKSRKGNKPLVLQSVSRIAKKWFNDAGYSGSNAILTLQKAWEMHYKKNHTDTQNNYDDGIHEIKQNSIQEAVYTQLLKAIISTRIKPGEKIVADRIAKKMNVSRIPVREALKRLETKGLIYTLKNRGLFASELTVKRMRELIDLRLLNEKEAIYKAAERSDDKFVKQLNILHNKYISEWKKNKPNSQIFEVNTDFHFAIYRYSGNPVLMDIISMLWDRFAPYLYVMIDQTEILSNQIDIDFHQKMIDGLSNKNPAEVYKWLEADILETKRILEEYFKLHT